jgi:hypothetical protein
MEAETESLVGLMEDRSPADTRPARARDLGRAAHGSGRN